MPFMNWLGDSSEILGSALIKSLIAFVPSR